MQNIYSYISSHCISFHFIRFNSLGYHVDYKYSPFKSVRSNVEVHTILKIQP